VTGGPGKHLLSSDFFWSEASTGQEIGVNDSFMTGPKTTAEIQIGQNRITLKPNTLIKFVREDVVRFNDGLIIVSGDEIKIKTTTAVHKVSGEATLSTSEEKDKVSVTKGEHTIVPDFVIEQGPVDEDKLVTEATERSLPPPLNEDYFMDSDWLKSKGINKSVFVDGETLSVSEWTSKVTSQNVLSGKAYVDGQEVRARYFYPFLAFAQEFEVSGDYQLIQKRRHNATLLVNGQTYDATERNRIALRPKRNIISYGHPFSKRDYTYYIDEDADEIHIKKTEYELSLLDFFLESRLPSGLNEIADAEEEEEEQTGKIKLEWEGRLKDNQIFLISIRDQDGQLILEDFAEESSYFWTPQAKGQFTLEVAVKSTVTSRILKRKKSTISVQPAEEKAVSILPDHSTILTYYVGAGVGLLNTTSKKGTDEVNVTGAGPLSLRLKAESDWIGLTYDTTVYFADIPDEESDRFFNYRLGLHTRYRSFVPMLVYQNNKIIVSEDETLKLENNLMWLMGAGYELNLKDLKILPSFLFNFGAYKGYQLALELSLPFAGSFEVVARGEMNQLEKNNLSVNYNQFTLLFGYRF
jgi:hypothetical protein